jgi:hypothetical protein
MQNTSLGKWSHKEGTKLLTNVTKLAGLSPASFDEAVKPIREYLQQFDEDGALSKLMLEDNITNHKVGDLYVRELLIPQGSFILSRVHKRPLVNIISKGKVTVIDSNGQTEYTAPSTFISPAGTQRIVLASEETVWNTAHITNVVDHDELVDDLTSDNYAEFVTYINQLEHKET